jgi:hypothetical protein
MLGGSFENNFGLCNLLNNKVFLSSKQSWGLGFWGPRQYNQQLSCVRVAGQ